jgi:hypothetical protein
MNCVQRTTTGTTGTPCSASPTLGSDSRSRSRTLVLASLSAWGYSLLLVGCDVKAPESTLHAETFRTPAPKDAGDDARVKESESAGDSISASLAVIHERLENLQHDYDEKAAVEGSLKDVANEMRPLIEAARNHCGALERAARDLKIEFPHARQAYLTAAASYRERAEAYRDPEFKAITLRLADEFDRLAEDTPRRLAVIELFLEELAKTEVFLAETERCVRDTSTALALFSARGKVPPVPADAKAFSYRLGQFIEAAHRYEEKLLEKPVDTPVSNTAEPAGTESGGTTSAHALLARYREVVTNSEARRQDGGTTAKPWIRILNPTALPPRSEMLTAQLVAADGRTELPVSMKFRRTPHAVAVVATCGGSDSRYVLKSFMFDDERTLIVPRDEDEARQPDQVCYEITIRPDGKTGTWSDGKSRGIVRIDDDARAPAR